MLDLIFPDSCSVCSSPVQGEGFLCSSCVGVIKYLDDLAQCSVCGTPFGYFDSGDEMTNEAGSAKADHLCGKCVVGEFSFEKARSVAFYDGKLRDMIHEFKYEGGLRHEAFFTDMIVEKFPYEAVEFDAVVPVPLHLSKLRAREYNQSSVIAQNLAFRTDMKYDLFVLRKTRETRPQFELKSERDRRKNVRGAFSVTAEDVYRGKSLLLIDDVFTTGATTQECSRVLLESGASRVSVLTLARAKTA